VNGSKGYARRNGGGGQSGAKGQDKAANCLNCKMGVQGKKGDRQPLLFIAFFLECETRESSDERGVRLFAQELTQHTRVTHRARERERERERER